jgi:zinc transport system permease protein
MSPPLAALPVFLPACLVGLTVAVLCSVLSVYVVLRRMAFIGQGISHAAFGGVALGLWLFPAAIWALDWRVHAVTVLFCLANAVAIRLIVRHSVLSEDTAIGMLFVISMSIGAVLFAVTPGVSGDLFSYLFGSILSVTWHDVGMTLGLMVLVIALVGAFHRELQMLCFDEQMARLAGIRTELLHHLLLLLLSLTVVVAIKVVGIVLVSAALVLPGATGRLVARSFGQLMAFAVVFGLLATGAGLFLSSRADVPPGAAVVLSQGALFVLIWLIGRFTPLHA